MPIKIIVPVALILQLMAAYNTVMTVNVQAKMARPALDLPRSILCGDLLTAPGWTADRVTYQTSTIQKIATGPQQKQLLERGEDGISRAKAGNFESAPWPQARTFVGDAAAMDLETLTMWKDLESTASRTMTIRGEKNIRALLQKSTDRLPVFHQNGKSPPQWLSKWQTFQDFESARFAHELGEFDRALTEYATLDDKSKIESAAGRLTAADSLLAFSVDGALVSLRGKTGDTHYVWHILYFDKETKTPVWHVGVGYTGY